MTTITATTPTEQDPPGRLDENRPSAWQRMLRQLGHDSLYVLGGFPLGVAAFCVMVTGISAGAGLLITVTGIPVLVITLFAARGFAHLERARIRPVLHRRPVTVVYRQPPPDAGWWRRMFTPLADAQAWLDVLHGIVRFPVSTATFVIATTWWAVAAGGITYWFWQQFLPVGNDDDLPRILGFGDGDSGRLAFYTVLGIFCTLTLPIVIRTIALFEAWVAHGLLNGVAGLRAEISGLTVQAQTARSQRAAAMSAEATALHRLERDIHDGPQQRLVRLAMDLGRARQQLDSADAGRGPGHRRRGARPRPGRPSTSCASLSRGIAPPILTDRGLAAAVSALAGRGHHPGRAATSRLDLGRLHPIAEQTALLRDRRGADQRGQAQRRDPVLGLGRPRRQPARGDRDRRRGRWRAPGQGARPGRPGRPGPLGRRRTVGGQPDGGPDENPSGAAVPTAT